MGYKKLNNMPRVLFGYKLQHKLKIPLTNAGFRLAKAVTEPFEVVRYEREKASVSRPDTIVFHGLEEGWYPYAIFGSASTVSISGEKFPLDMKHLSPDFTSDPVKDRWKYSSEQELEACLNQIASLVENELQRWFEKPVMNPAGLSSEPAIKLNREELIAKLLEMLRVTELALERARAEKDEQAIERYERGLSGYRDKL